MPHRWLFATQSETDSFLHKFWKYLEFRNKRRTVRRVCVCVCVYACVLWLRQQLFRNPTHSPHVGWLHICSWQSALGACGWPQWMKPCFCPCSPPSLSSPLTLPPFWWWNQTIVMLSSAAEICQSHGALCCSLCYEWGRFVLLSQESHKKRIVCSTYLVLCFCLLSESVCFSCLFVCLFVLVVEDDEDDFPNTRTDGDFLYHHNGSKEKCE